MVVSATEAAKEAHVPESSSFGTRRSHTWEAWVGAALAPSALVLNSPLQVALKEITNKHWYKSTRTMIRWHRISRSRGLPGRLETAHGGGVVGAAWERAWCQLETPSAAVLGDHGNCDLIQIQSLQKEHTSTKPKWKPQTPDGPVDARCA